MANFFSYWDESGKHDAHQVIVFNGLVDKPEPWIAFFEKWHSLLRQYELPYFHAVQALRHSVAYGTMKRGTAEDRAKDVLPFVDAITHGIEVGIQVAVDVAAYKSAHQKLHNRFGGDPHLFAFYLAISEILRYWQTPKHLTFGMILDDEEKKAKLCYDLWTKLKMIVPEVREQITTICFADDKTEPALQAADLFCYLCRLESERRFFGKPHPYQALFDALRPAPGHRMRSPGGFYGKQQINDYVVQQVLPLKQRLAFGEA